MRDEFEALMERNEGDDIGSKYRYVFASPLGREVLADLLSECHFGETLDLSNPHKIAEYNVGVMVLAKCGVFGPKTKMDVINALLNVIPKSKEVER